jgi:hypothetical protein
MSSFRACDISPPRTTALSASSRREPGAVCATLLAISTTSIARSSSGIGIDVDTSRELIEASSDSGFVSISSTNLQRRNSLFAQFKTRLKESFKTGGSNSASNGQALGTAEESQVEISCQLHGNQKDADCLQVAYYNLLCAILDPNAQMRQVHNFQVKTFTKLTMCDECRSLLWGRSIFLFILFNH